MDDSLFDDVAAIKSTGLVSPKGISTENRWTKESFTIFIL
ncbi:hypothetical protein D1AOALGA4SA_7354 [Olavius algarvensis Delta 1 endosymbiont]|nr:hypothetical protein D1AOALGA4SA_7354 [Olavius algarvensis Delta 1 endosymbiont]